MASVIAVLAACSGSTGAAPERAAPYDASEPASDADVSDREDASSGIDFFESACLAREGTRVEVSGLRKAPYRNYEIAENTILDATDAWWDGTNEAGVPIPWVVTVNGAGPACWYGGNYVGPWDDTSPDVTWEDPYHHSGAFTIRMGDFLVEGLRAHNQGDGIRMEGGGSNFWIRGAYLSDIHDDCIENDALHGGVLEDSLLEGCYVGFSAADFTHTRDGSANTWEIRENLVWIKDMPTVYRGTAPGSGMLWKGWWQAPGPKVVLKDNVFRADSDADIGSLGIPAELTLEACERNTFVWLGEGPFPDPLPDCFTVTTDKSVWDHAVAAWKQRHPGIAD